MLEQTSELDQKLEELEDTAAQIAELTQSESATDRVHVIREKLDLTRRASKQHLSELTERLASIEQLELGITSITEFVTESLKLEGLEEKEEPLAPGEKLQLQEVEDYIRVQPKGPPTASRYAILYIQCSHLIDVSYRYVCLHMCFCLFLCKPILVCLLLVFFTFDVV